MLHIPKKALLMASRLRPQEVFAVSTYSGSGSTQTVTNGLDLAGKGGFVWLKRRNDVADHGIFDTQRGANLALRSNSTAAEELWGGYGVSSFLSSGFTIAGNQQVTNGAGGTYVAWSFRQARGFLSIVTYTGNGVAGRQIPHDLGVMPGMIVVKARSATSIWPVWHRGLSNPAASILILNQTDAADNAASGIFGAAPTASTFTVGVNQTNAAGVQYVAYVFAHNPDLIDCGSYTGNGSATGPVVTCGSGWEPQFTMIKDTSAAADWFIFDSARGMAAGADPALRPNSSSAEVTGLDWIEALSTGFRPRIAGSGLNNAGNQYVHLSIRKPT